MLTYQATNAAPTADLPDGFHYVSQDNVCTVRPAATEFSYLYADSATSCIIVVITGEDADRKPVIMLSHLSRTRRFNAFFNQVDATFCGPVHLFAQGGNPPFAEAANTNTHTLMQWMTAHSLANFDTAPISEKPGWWIEQATVSVGQGDPNDDHRDDYGIDLSTMTVSNKPFTLTPEQRDPTGGVQTLYAVFGMKIYPPLWLWPSTRAFDDHTISKLVAAANREDWTQILKMSDEEILQTYSTTPQWEVPWFSETLRQSAKFVQGWNEPQSSAGGVAG
jgi:hypothetical protein